MFVAVNVTLRDRENEFAPHYVEGFAPYADCPLAVTPAFDVGKRIGWRARNGEWFITHRSTGFTLGNTFFKARDAAERVLNLCNPVFPAWLMATGTAGDAATLACKAMFRAACSSEGVKWVAAV